MAAKFGGWFVFFSIFCLNFYFNSAEDVSEIKLTLSRFRGKLICDAPPLVNIEVGKQFRIVVDPGKTYFHNIRMCHKSLESNESVHTQFWKEDPGVRYGYSSNEFNANTPGDWDYKCVFFTENCTYISSTNKCSYNDGFPRTIDGIKCLTKVHVYNHGEIVVQPSSYMSVNAANFPSMEDDYKFYDAEGTNFTCHKTAGSYIKLTYTSRVGQQICTTGYERTDSVNMYIKLRDTDYGNTLSCNATDDQYGHEYGVKLRLEHRNRRDMLTFEVNGLILPLTKQTSGTDYYYLYKYYDGENVTVAVVKDDEVYGDVRCSADGPHVPVLLNSYFQNRSMSINSVVFIIKQVETGTTLTCTVLRKRGGHVYHIILTFLFYIPNYSPYISGLPMSNVLLQYSNETSNVVHYGIGRETLELDCLTSANNLPTKWVYNTGEISSQNDRRNPRPFLLHPYRNQTTIKCQVNSTIETKTTYLQLIRRNESATMPVPTTTPATSRGTISTRSKPRTTTTAPPTTTTTPRTTTTLTTSRTTASSSSQHQTTNTNVRPTVSKQERQERVLKIKIAKTPARKKIKTPARKKVKPNATKASTRPTKKPDKPAVQLIKDTTIPAKSSTPTLAVESTIHKANSSHSSTVGQPPKPSHTVTPTNIPATEVRVTPAVVGGVTARTDQIGGPSDGGSGSTKWMIVAGVVLVILVVAFILWVAFRKKKQILKHSTSNTDYQDLPAHNEGQMATPAQWDRSNDALYANSNSINNLYSKPTPKNQRNITEPTYANPRDSIKHTYINSQQINNDPTYATVQGNEPTYASVQNNEPTYASVQNKEPTYASVQNKEPTYASVQNNEPTYASVQNNAPAYACMQKSTNAQPDATYANQKLLEYQNLNALKQKDTYAEVNKGKSIRNTDSPYNNGSKSHYQNQGNVLDDVIYTDVVSGKYVNADVKNEVEPAYCEVIKKK